MAVDVASGAVSLLFTDVSVPGAFPMVWKRRYSTRLLESEVRSPLGTGWAGSFHALLIHSRAEWRFVTPAGSLIRFADPEGRVERGGKVTEFGSYHEIRKSGAGYAITSWDPKSHEVVRFLFPPARDGIRSLLHAVENLSGHGLEFSWSESGLLRGVRQKLERRTLAFTHDSMGRLKEIAFVKADGGRIGLAKYDHGTDGRLVSAWDPNGYADHYEYDREGRIVRQIAKDGGVFSFRYDDAGRCIKTWGMGNYDSKSLRFYDSVGRSEVIDSLGNRTHYVFLPGGQIASETNPMGGVRNFEYDGFGRLLKEEDSLGRSKTYAYDEAGNRVKETDALGNALSYEFNDVHQSISFVDACGNTWKKTFGPDRRLESTTDPCGAEWRFGYHANGRPAEIRNPLGPVMRFAYHVNGDLAAITDWDGHLWKYAWDGLGRISEIENPVGRKTRSVFDPAGNLIQFVDHSGATYTFRYDARKRRIESAGPDGRRHRREYGPCGRLARIHRPDGTTLSYRWGTEPGRLLEILDGRGASYVFEYDGNGSKTRERAFDGKVTCYRRNAFGECIATGPDPARMIRFEHDKAGRIVAKSLPDGAVTRFGYDGMGRLASAENPDCRLEFERDPAGRVIREVQGGHELAFEYDAAGNLIRLRVDDEMHSEYGYEGGFFRWAELKGSHRVRFGKGGPADPVIRELPGSLSVTHRLDQDGMAVLQTVSKAGTALADRSFRWGKEGRLSAVTGKRGGIMGFAYDDSGRLTAKSYPDGSRDRIARDAQGDIVAWSRAGSDRDSAVIDPGGRVKEADGFGYGYDPAGRLRNRMEAGETGKNWEYEWDDFDQLRSVVDSEGKRWRYAYDALGRRIRKNGPGISIGYVWFKHVIVRQTGRPEGSSDWLFAPGSFVPIANASRDRTYSIITDPNGTPLELYDEAGNPAGTLDYDLMGGCRTSGGAPCELRFPGQWHDEESGLHYNRFRYYDPASGKYLSQDPIGLRGGFKPYDYGSDPVNWIDPFGLAMLFRGMKKDAEGKPVVYSGPSGNGNNAADSLGVRPGEEGMSTNTDTAAIQEHRKPEAHGGSKSDEKTAMYVIDSDDLAAHGLVHDPDHDSHVSIKTAPGEDPSTLGERLAATKELWKPVTPEEAAKIMEEEAKKQGGCNG